MKKKLLTKSERCDKIIFADNKSEMKKTKNKNRTLKTEQLI